MLRPQAIMLAIFPSEPLSPALKIPHSGLMPTGAMVALAERPVSVLGEFSSSWGEVSVRRVYVGFSGEESTCR